MSKIRIRAKKPWIGYAGSTIQQSYGEFVDHGYLMWRIAKDNVDVAFHKLHNPGPYVTLDYQGSVDATMEHAQRTLPPRCRLRLRSTEHIAQNDVYRLEAQLRSNFEIIEFTLKSEIKRSSALAINDDNTDIAREDLRNPDVLLRLTKSYYGDSVISITDEEWKNVHALISTYVASVTSGEEALRNVKWSLRKISFENTFGYGESNSIDFEKLSGIVGIFGPNRAGKSSIVGSIIYGLFNTTDRGAIKNLHVINTRKKFCSATSIINVGGVDHIIERMTTKNENRKGVVSAATALNVFRVNNKDNIDDLVGEQRTDTERVVRKLIGMPEDFMLTSLSAQDEINQFIKHGSTKRRQVLSKFLDVDIFDKMHELANKDTAAFRAQLKVMPNVTQEDIETIENSLVSLDDEFADIDRRLVDAGHERDTLQARSHVLKGATVVTDDQIASQKRRVEHFNKQVTVATQGISEATGEITKLTTKLSKITVVKADYDVVSLREKVKSVHEIAGNLKSLRHEVSKEDMILKQQKKSLTILTEVPCGDEFPTCKFIKDAHSNKALIGDQTARVEQLNSRLVELDDQLFDLRKESYEDKLKKIEQILELETNVKLNLSKREGDLERHQAALDVAAKELARAEVKCRELLALASDEDNTEANVLRTELNDVQVQIKTLDASRMALTLEKGKLGSQLESKQRDYTKREQLLSQMKLYDLITGAFSKKGLPSLIVNSQLPLINDEIAKILHGIVDFTVELEFEGESDFLEVYINYGDSRRPIELGSGMEKMISSLAIRVALIKVSSLSKSDMLIIDEGFGALDEAGVEACNRLLISLKEHFRVVVVITHVEGIKDVADTVLEITKDEKDSKIVYDGS